MSVAPVLTPRGLAAGSEAKVSHFEGQRQKKKKKKKRPQPPKGESPSFSQGHLNSSAPLQREKEEKEVQRPQHSGG
jgi:hypothetical protein